MKLRIKFTKHGVVRYIGHLDLQRYFQRANRRAGIKVVYSEGFSPHQKMSFAMPLSVGYESDAEYFDLEVSEASSSKEVKDALNAQQTEGIGIVSCVLLPEKCENAMASVRAAEYTVGFREHCGPDFDIDAAIKKAMAGGPFIIRKPVKKKGKKGRKISKASYNTMTMLTSDGSRGEEEAADYKETDIRPFIYELYTDDDGNIHIKASAGSENNIRPDTVISALYEKAGSVLPEHALVITINELYTYADDGRTLIPLCDAGSEF